VARAGFWSVGGYEISFRRDGHWYADDDLIENERIAWLFSSHIQSDGDAGWVVDLGIDRQPVVVEDTPLVVVSITRAADGSFEQRTNDGITEALDPSTLAVGDDHVLYCTVDRGPRGTMRARFLRPAYYALMEYVELEEERPVLRTPSGTHVLG
jgi:hypothetical protein